MRRRPDADPNSAVLFVFRILYLPVERVEPADVVVADATAMPLCPQGFHT
jgi:hypothetical protein